MEVWVVLAGSVLVLGVLVARALVRANRLVDQCLAELSPPEPPGGDDDAEPGPGAAGGAEPAPGAVDLVRRAADRRR